MQNLQQIKIEKEKKVSQLIKDSRMFFAFSTEQFQESKTEKEPEEKYVHLGAGCYLPKSKVDFYLDGSAEINKWFKETVKANKQKKALIIYELNNHEAFYTNDIEDTAAALSEDYTKEEILEVFNSEFANQTQYQY